MEVSLIQTAPKDTPELKITVEGRNLGAEIEAVLRALFEKMLGLRTDLSDFDRLARRDRNLKTLVAKFRGMKPPRYPTVFEALVNAVTCQQFTLTAGIQLLGRLVESRGLPFSRSGQIFRAFPRPEDIGGTDIEELRRIGYSRQKASYLIEAARMVIEEGLNLEDFGGLDDEKALETLKRLRGVGRWTAEYILLRGLGRVHVFPGDDVGVRNRLQKWLEITGPLDYEGVSRILAPWSPYGGLVYFLLLLNGLKEQGVF